MREGEKPLPFHPKKADPKLKWISFFLDEMAIIFNLSS